MERLVRLRDLRPTPSGGTVFLDLPDLLPLFDPDGHAWTWGFQRVPELVADEGWDFNLAVLEQHIVRDRRGLTMTFEELLRFGHRVRQVIWGEFIAADAPGALPLTTDTAEAVGRQAVAGLAAIDSTYWLVGGPSSVIERIAATFDDVDHLEPHEWIRADD